MFKKKYALSSGRQGFTLLETLVVISVVGIIAAWGMGFLASVLRGGAKTSIVSEIKQNGNHALNIISFYIRNAISIENCTTTSLSLRQLDTSLVTFSLLPTDGLNFNNRLASNSSSLTNGDIKNGVEVSSLSFSCNTTVSPNLVTVDFTLTQARLAPARFEYQASERFNTTVGLRTY